MFYLTFESYLFKNTKISILCRQVNTQMVTPDGYFTDCGNGIFLCLKTPHQGSQKNHGIPAFPNRSLYQYLCGSIC